MKSKTKDELSTKINIKLREGEQTINFNQAELIEKIYLLLGGRRMPLYYTFYPLPKCATGMPMQYKFIELNQLAFFPIPNDDYEIEITLRTHEETKKEV